MTEKKFSAFFVYGLVTNYYIISINQTKGKNMTLFFGYIGLIIVLAFVSLIITCFIVPGVNPDDTWTEKEKKTFYTVNRILWIVITIILFYCYGVGEDSVLNNKEYVENFACITLFSGIAIGTLVLAKIVDMLVNKIKNKIKKKGV